MAAHHDRDVRNASTVVLMAIWVNQSHVSAYMCKCMHKQHLGVRLDTKRGGISQ